MARGITPVIIVPDYLKPMYPKFSYNPNYIDMESVASEEFDLGFGGFDYAKNIDILKSSIESLGDNQDDGEDLHDEDIFSIGSSDKFSEESIFDSIDDLMQDVDDIPEEEEDISEDEEEVSNNLFTSYSSIVDDSELEDEEFEDILNINLKSKPIGTINFMSGGDSD